MKMPTNEFRRTFARRAGERWYVKPLAAVSVILSVFVATVVTMALKDGTSAALVTAFLVFIVAATGLGVLGAAMCVRDTHEFTSSSDAEDSRPVPVRNAVPAP
jgi:Flp pilus assembly protein TadB